MLLSELRKEVVTWSTSLLRRQSITSGQLRLAYCLIERAKVSCSISLVGTSIMLRLSRVSIRSKGYRTGKQRGLTYLDGA